MQDPDSLASFIGKWRARWPEWAVAEVFVPQAQRDVALAWASLQQELADAAWAGSDPRPGEAKLAWWQEELHGWARGARRHPLGLTMQRRDAPWQGLAGSLPSLAAARERAGDADELFATLQPFARQATAIDAALFSGDPDAEPGSTEALVTAALLQSRFVHADDGVAPLDVVARAGEGGTRAAWAAQLHRDWPDPRAVTRVRRLWAALARERLRRTGANVPLPPWTTLRVAWRAARRVPH